MGLTSQLNETVKQACHVGHVDSLTVRLKQSQALILNYHGILEGPRPDRWSYENYVTAESFRTQLRWLKRSFEPTDLDGFESWHAGQWTHRRPPLLVTFDDGYKNNLTVAAPILLDESIPALFFLSTAYIGTTNVLWNHEVLIRVLKWPLATLKTPGGSETVLPAGLHERRTLATQIKERCKRLSQPVWVEYLEYLRSLTPNINTVDDTEARAFLSWEDSQKLADLGFELGSHTVNHPILSNLDSSQITRELMDSKAMIESQTGVRCRSFAYPNGGHQDINDDVVAAVEQADYEWAFTTQQTWVSHGCNRFKLPRIGFPGQVDLATFTFHATGLHSLLTRSASA